MSSDVVVIGAGIAGWATALGLRRAQQAAIPAGRYGTPQEFGAICAFLCSQHAGYVAATAAIRRILPDDAPSIVAVTANAAPEVVKACEEAGFADVLSKPVDYHELSATVRRYLAQP